MNFQRLTQGLTGNNMNEANMTTGTNPNFATNSNPMTGNTQNNQGEDSVDKALDKVEGKFAAQHGMADPSAKMRGTNEKITDKARNVLEKVTGKHIPDKVSN